MWSEIKNKKLKIKKEYDIKEWIPAHRGKLHTKCQTRKTRSIAKKNWLTQHEQTRAGLEELYCDAAWYEEAFANLRKNE